MRAGTSALNASGRSQVVVIGVKVPPSPDCKIASITSVSMALKGGPIEVLVHQGSLVHRHDACQCALAPHGWVWLRHRIGRSNGKSVNSFERSEIVVPMRAAGKANMCFGSYADPAVK